MKKRNTLHPVLKIYETNGKYVGKLIWTKNSTKLDDQNPDVSKRSQKRMGLVIMNNFKFDGDDEWKGGNIYDPESGKTYSSYIYLKDKSTIKVRGYVGISLFGRTETWTRTN